MVTPEKSKLYTMAEFIEFALRPENADKDFELINGEIVEMMSRTRYAEYHDIIVAAVGPFCKEHNIPIHISSGDGDFDILGNTLIPNFAYKRTIGSYMYPDPEPPLWVVEVITPTDKATDIRKKRQIYRQARILLWEMYPMHQSIDVFTPGQPLRTFNIDDTLDGGDVLPGFTLPVKNIFAR